MIQHLSHCIANHLKVGYANLLITLLESCGVSMTNYERLKLKTNHYVQPRTLEARNLTVVNGVTQFLSESLTKTKQDEGSVKKMEEEELDRWLEEEDSEGEGEKKTKEVLIMPAKSAPSVGKRKSTRLAFRPKGKDKAESTAVVDLCDEKGEERTFVQGEQGTFVQETGGSQSVPAGESLGFTGFNSVSAALELKNLKGTVQKLVDAQPALVQRIEALEKMVSDLAKASTALTSAVQQSTSTISQGQSDLLKKLEDLVIEEVSEEDAGEEHLSSAPEA